MTATNKAIAPRLLAWFDVHGRHDLPWQEDASPYRTWVSEIMLQQTQVATVIPYFQRFMTSFPSVEVLASAPLDDVLHHWSGLGYYARARNLHKAANIIRDDYAGLFPKDIDAVVALPGIGRSTAGAILSLAAGQRHPILDGNVKRVLARQYGIAGWAGMTAVAQQYWQYAEAETPHERVADYTQAIMDLGATLCTRSKPRCAECPLQTSCVAFSTNSVDQFPGRRQKAVKPLRATRMVLAHDDSVVLLHRRPATGIWGGLWSFPELDSVQTLQDWCSNQLGDIDIQEHRWEMLRHSFSHYDLDIQPIELRLAAMPMILRDSPDVLWYDFDTPPAIGLAAPVSKLLALLQQNRDSDQ